MSAANSKWGERHDLTVYDWDPGATSATAFSSTWISLQDVGEVVGILASGGGLLAGSITIKIQGATSSAGAGATDIVTGTAGVPDAAGDYLYVSATANDFATTMPEATHFMVIGTTNTGTDEGTGIIIVERQRTNRATELANSIA